MRERQKTSFMCIVIDTEMIHIVRLAIVQIVSPNPLPHVLHVEEL